MSDVTRILTAIERGDLQAADELLPIVYQELRLLAAQMLSRERPGQTLQATALVHEAYLRLVGAGDGGWQGQRHFFGAAAEAMRRILVESARRKMRLRHGGGRQRCDLDEADLTIDPPSDDLLALDEALTKFTQKDPDKAAVVKLRYFAGLTLQQVSELLDIPASTAKWYWTYARTWLHREMTGGGEHPSPTA